MALLHMLPPARRGKGEKKMYTPIPDPPLVRMKDLTRETTTFMPSEIIQNVAS